MVWWRGRGPDGRVRWSGAPSQEFFFRPSFYFSPKIQFLRNLVFLPSCLLAAVDIPFESRMTPHERYAATARQMRGTYGMECSMDEVAALWLACWDDLWKMHLALPDEWTFMLARAAEERFRMHSLVAP